MHFPKRLFQWLIIAAASAIFSACGVTRTGSISPGASGTVVQEAEIFTVSGPAEERQAVQDVAAALAAHAPQVRRDLDYDYRFPVSVELFADQESLDRGGMNPEMQGYYAYSGDRRIQMVSPRRSMPGLDIPYEARVSIAAHEFAHLVIGEINPEVPLWLNEGAAVYFGPHAVYTYVCQNGFPFDQIPRIAALEASYSSVPAADLFAFSLVDYLVDAYGLDGLNRLIRAPGEMEGILGITRGQMERDWHSYMEQHYHNSETKE